MLNRRQFLFASALQGQRRPNVVFVLCSGWRRDKEWRVPHLARLAGEGVEFTRAYVANPASGPSQAALHTGRYPHSVSVPWNGRALPPEYACLSQAFAEAGYSTGYVGKWHLGGVARGFQSSGYEPGREAELALEFIGKNKGRPFLLFVSFGPVRPGVFPPESIAPRANVPAELEAEARKAAASYNGMLASIDEVVGRLLRALDEGGLAEGTLVVFTSDRGELLFSHGAQAHDSWYEEPAGVPLVMRWPGKLTAGSKQDWLFNNIDVAPTVRGLCGLAPIEDAQGEDRSGLILNKGTRPESVYIEGELGTPHEWRMVVRGWDKLVVDRELRVTHLYNLAQDPWELDNLAGDRGTIRRQEELLALIRRWIIKSGDRVPFGERRPVERN